MRIFIYFLVALTTAPLFCCDDEEKDTGLALALAASTSLHRPDNHHLERSPAACGMGGSWHQREGAASPTTVNRRNAEDFAQLAIACARRIKNAEETTPKHSLRELLASATSLAGTGALVLQRSQIVRTRSVGGTVALMTAGAVAAAGALAIWEGDRIQMILGLSTTLKKLKRELTVMEREIRALKATNTELLNRVDGIELLSADVRQGLAAVKLVSGDNARLADIVQKLLHGYVQLDTRMKELELMLPEEQREQLHRTERGVGFDNIVDILSADQRREQEKALAVKAYNKRFKFTRWNRVETFDELPENVRRTQYAHLMTS